MKTLFALLLAISTFQFSHSALAGCTLHISNLDVLLENPFYQREDKFLLETHARKKGIYLKMNSNELRNGDYVINELIHESGAVYNKSNYIRLPGINAVGRFWWVEHKTGYDFSRNLMISRYENGTIKDIAIQKLSYKTSVAKARRSSPVIEVIKEVISDFKQCR